MTQNVSSHCLEDICTKPTTQWRTLSSFWGGDTELMHWVWSAGGEREGESSRGAQCTQCDCCTGDLHFAYRLEQLLSVHEVQDRVGGRGGWGRREHERERGRVNSHFGSRDVHHITWLRPQRVLKSLHCHFPLLKCLEISSDFNKQSHSSIDDTDARKWHTDTPCQRRWLTPTRQKPMCC